VPPVGKARKATNSGASPERGFALQARLSGLPPGGGVVGGGAVGGGTVTGGAVGGGPDSVVTAVGGSPSCVMATVAAPAPTTATAPRVRGVISEPPTNPAGRAGNTAAGPVREMGATTSLRHSLALRTTTGSYSSVWPEEEPSTAT
jgi:hypothetical protein